jgi:hypothetical protein
MGAAVAMLVVVVLYFAIRNLMVNQEQLIPVLYLLVIGVAAGSTYLLLSGRVLRFTRAIPLPIPQTGGA